MYFNKRTKIDSLSIVETEEWSELLKFSNERTNRMRFDQTIKCSTMIEKNLILIITEQFLQVKNNRKRDM